jgi:hypothetical protein
LWQLTNNLQQQENKMKTFGRKLMLAVAILTGLALIPAVANAQGKVQRMVVDPSGQPSAYYAYRLGAEFEIQTMQIPGYVFRAARIVSEPEFGSPLNQLGLQVGDVITRLDGIPVTNYAELDRHAYRTVVRYIKAGTTYPRNGVIYISGGSPVSPVMVGGVIAP